MDLDDLRSFLAVVDAGGFTRAADEVRAAQPVVSRRVARLERDVGTRLLDRTTRRVTVTPAGERLAARARSILAEVDIAQAELRALDQGLAGRVSIGFVGTATYDVLPRVAREVRRALPGVDLDLHGDLLNPRLLDGLAHGEYDVALLRPPGSPAGVDGLDVRVVRSERLVAVVPAHHRLARRRRLALEELADEPFVIHPSGDRSSMHGRVLAACAEAGFAPPSLLEVGETATLVVFVAAGLGVALLPEPARSLGLEGVGYVALRSPATVDLALATRAGDPSPAVRRVTGIVERCVRGGVSTAGG